MHISECSFKKSIDFSIEDTHDQTTMRRYREDVISVDTG